MSRNELPALDWSGRYLQNTDGTWEMVDDDGFVVDLPAIYQTPDFGMYDIALPQREPFAGPPAPTRMPDGLPTVEAMETFAAAVREWGES